MKILVLDIGTSSARGTLMDELACVHLRQQINYRPTYKEGGIVEQAPSDWLDGVISLCSAASAQDTVDAIALTAQRSSLIPADAEGRALTDAIMWQDTRNQALCDRISLQEHNIHAISGIQPNTVCSGGKMAWLRENRPALYDRSAHLFVIPDYLIFHMTGQHVTDHTYGSRSMLMELENRTWSQELIRLFSVAPDKLGRLIAPSSIAGYLSEDFAAKCALPAGIPVITCGGDQQCGALGMGVYAPGAVSVNMGTGIYLMAPMDKLPLHLNPRLTYSASAIPGKYLLEAGILTGGSALDWFFRELGGDLSMIKAALLKSPPGARGVTALPYFQGRTSPDWNSGARALFASLSLGTTKLDLLRGLLEGICVEIGQNLDSMEIGQAIHTLYLGGGLSQTPELGQLLSDVTGLEISCSDQSDATTRGAWMSAVHCLRLVSNWDNTWQQIRPTEKYRFSPNPELTALYKGIAAKMERLYSAIQPS